MKSISDIDTTTKEGMFLMAALARLTLTVDRNMNPNDCLQNLQSTVDAMYSIKDRGELKSP